MTEVTNAFANQLRCLSYFILDASGSVRFAFTQVSEIPRQLDALAHLQADLQAGTEPMFEGGLLPWESPAGRFGPRW